MTKILCTKNVKTIIQQLGFKPFILGFLNYLEADFKNWSEFDKTPRIPFYKNQGVMELMPVCGNELFAFKYVNGHPNNTLINKPTVLGVGMLCDTKTGEPLLISEMTLLTALRTAGTSLLASKYLAGEDISAFGIIGNGSQSEFQTLAHQAYFGFKKVYFFDKDDQAMKKFATNLTNQGFELIPCQSAQEVCQHSQIITTATACSQSQEVLKLAYLKPGQHLNCIGGDSPNKTELDPKILTSTKIVVEYFEQTKHEGEIQNLGNKAKSRVNCELWELINKTKTARLNQDDITLFDSVGFALEDYSILRYIYNLALELNIFNELELTPDLDDCKNLYSKINTKTTAYIGHDHTSRFTTNINGQIKLR